MARHSIPSEIWVKVEGMLAQGFNHTEISKLAGISRGAVARYANGEKTSGERIRRVAEHERLPAVKAAQHIREPAKDALEDFGLFRARYFGRVSTPWQILAGQKLSELLASDNDEFLVINVSPGSGKSTMLTDVCTWMIGKHLLA